MFIRLTVQLSSETGDYLQENKLWRLHGKGTAWPGSKVITVHNLWRNPLDPVSSSQGLLLEIAWGLGLRLEIGLGLRLSIALGLGLRLEIALGQELRLEITLGLWLRLEIALGQGLRLEIGLG